MKKEYGVFFKFCLANKEKIIFFLILFIFIFLRFYDLPGRANLGWDQADSAWAAKSIITDNPLRLEGVPIKGNAGMVMGPLYYYLITPFYFFTNLDPIASPIFAGAVSIVGFLVFFYITKKLFNIETALIGSFIYTFSLFVMRMDGVQAAYVLIPTISYAIFYCLYRLITGNDKYIMTLAALIGFGFHVHFTTIFYPIIFLFTLPFLPRNKKFLLHLALSIPIFMVFLLPTIYSLFFQKANTSGGFLNHLSTFYHGLHLRRVLQISYDAFISVEGILQFKILRPFVFIIPPLFTVIYYFSNRKKKSLLLPYLFALWIVVPWIALATYSGELTDYYFSIPRNITIAAIAFMIVVLFKRKSFFAKMAVIIILGGYAINNLYWFARWPAGNYLEIQHSVKETIKKGEVIKFKDRDPKFYMYYIYTEYR